jgi:arabinofuranan 3-O-arabinosyltransferase
VLLEQVDVTVDRASPAQIVRVVTEAGSSAEVPIEPGTTVGVPVPAGQTEWVRVEDARGGAAAFSLAEVDWAGRGEVVRPLVLPVLPGAWGAPDQVLLRALRDGRTGCATVEGSPRCLEDRARPSEEGERWSRVVTMPEDAGYPVVVRAVARPGRALTAMLQEGQAITVTGSSTGPPDSRVSPLAAVDGNRGTTWTAAVGDGRAQLDLEWLGERRITGIRVRRNLGVPVRRPAVVRLTWPGGSETVNLGRDGRTTFPAIRTERMGVRVVESENAVSVNADGSRSLLPIGIGELRLRGLGLLPAPPSREVRSWPCGTGPTVTIGDTRVRTALQASADELFGMEQVPALPCRPTTADLAAGENLVEVEASQVAVADSVRLGTGPGGGSAAPVGLEAASPVERRLQAPPGDAVVAVRENANPGWEASRDGEPVEPVVVDGWQQAWRVTGGEGPVVATFGPDRPYRSGLAVGAGLFLLLVLLPLVPARRWPGATMAPLVPARAPLLVLLVIGAVAAGLLAGWAGLGCFAVTAGAAWVIRTRLPGDTATWLAGGLLVVAAAAYFLRPWGSEQGWAGDLAWPHYLVVAAVSWALLACAEPRPRPRRRIAGISTTR